MRRFISFLWTVLLAGSLVLSLPAASNAAGQKEKEVEEIEDIEDVEDEEEIEDVEDEEEVTTEKKEKKPEKLEKKEGGDKPLDEKPKEQEEAKPPDLVPADERRESSEELDALGDADYPDLVPADEESALMDEFDLLMEEEIVYSVAKHQQHIAESPSAVTVITREMIEGTHCTNVTCLLRQVPEVDVRWVVSSYPVVGARALTDPFYGDKALVLVDGREVNIELFGIPLWQALPVHMEDIERIEVIRGPGSALYGPNAHSMVVAITTRPTKDSAAEVFLGGGEFYETSLSLRMDKRLGAFRVHVSGGRITTGAWRLKNRREGEINRSRLRVDYEIEKSTLTLELGFTDMQGIIYTSLGPAEAQQGFLGHGFLVFNSDWLRAQVSYSMLSADMAFDLPLEYLGIKMGEFPEIIPFFSGNLDTDLQLTWAPFKGNLIIMGMSHRWFTMVSETMEQETTYEHRLGVFIHHENKLIERLTLTDSLRLDYNNITPTAFTVSPRVALVWRFTETQLVRIAFGQAFRKPCYYNTSTHITEVKEERGFEGLEKFIHDNIGNEKLENESLTALETGYRGHFFDNSFVVEGDVFYHQYRDTINFHFEMKADQFGVPDFNTSVLEFRNEGREVDSLGGSISLTYRLKKALRVNLNYTLRYSWYISESEDPTEAGGKGDRISWEPMHFGNLALHYLQEQGLRVGLAVHAASDSDLALPEYGGLFDEVVSVHNPAKWFTSAYLAWRANLHPFWIEGGIRAFNVIEMPFHDTPAVTRPDGVLLGGELIGRRIFVFLRGSI